MPGPRGTLYVVATPLGNLGDLSTRAAELLRQVPVVAAEDTRHTRKLLARLDAHPRLLSWHAHSDPGRLDQLIRCLVQGEDVALVSDAGTPAVSDPGARLVEAAREASCPVVPLPGPSAVITALSATGFSADRFLFLGFLPRKGRDRERLLDLAGRSEWTVVLYEAPNRLGALLADLARVAGPDRRGAVARELTKLHEEVTVARLDQLAARWAEAEPRGECTVVVEGRGEDAGQPPPDAGTARAEAIRLLGEGVSRREAARRVAQATGLSRNDAYRLVMELP